MLLQTEMQDSESGNRVPKHENDSIRNVIDNIEKLSEEAKFSELTAREQLER